MALIQAGSAKVVRKCSGFRVSYVDANSISLTPTPNGNYEGIVPVTNGTVGFDVVLNPSSAWNCSLATPGSGGLLTGYVRTNNTLYCLYLAYCSSTGEKALFFAPYNVQVNLVVVASLTNNGSGTAFDFYSSCLGAVRNLVATIVPFENPEPGKFLYLPSVTTDVQVLTTGVAIVNTAVNCTGLVPTYDYSGFFGRYLCENTNAIAPTPDIYIFEYDGTNYVSRNEVDNIDDLVGTWRTPSGIFKIGNGRGRSPVDVLNYRWTAAPSIGLTLQIHGFELQGF